MCVSMGGRVPSSPCFRSALSVELTGLKSLRYQEELPVLVLITEAGPTEAVFCILHFHLPVHGRRYFHLRCNPTYAPVYHAWVLTGCGTQ